MTAADESQTIGEADTPRKSPTTPPDSAGLARRTDRAKPSPTDQRWITAQRSTTGRQRGSLLKLGLELLALGGREFGLGPAEYGGTTDLRAAPASLVGMAAPTVIEVEIVSDDIGDVGSHEVYCDEPRVAVVSSRCGCLGARTVPGPGGQR